MQISDNVMTTHTLHILCKFADGISYDVDFKTFFSLFFLPSCSPSPLDPPSTPIISGYTEGSVIPAGSNQKLLCMSSGGNPPPTLTWFKNDKKVNKS
jgi:hypothetical protein